MSNVNNLIVDLVKFFTRSTIISSSELNNLKMVNLIQSYLKDLTLKEREGAMMELLEIEEVRTYLLYEYSSVCRVFGTILPIVPNTVDLMIANTIMESGIPDHDLLYDTDPRAYHILKAIMNLSKKSRKHFFKEAFSNEVFNTSFTLLKMLRATFRSKKFRKAYSLYTSVNNEFGRKRSFTDDVYGEANILVFRKLSDISLWLDYEDSEEPAYKESTDRDDTSSDVIALELLVNILRSNSRK